MFLFSEHKHASRRLRALLYGNRADGAACGAGRQESRVLTPSQTPGHLTEGKDDVSAGTLSERAPHRQGRECPRVADGGSLRWETAPQPSRSTGEVEPPYPGGAFVSPAAPPDGPLDVSRRGEGLHL
jgi:hypothetical protein